MRKKVFIIHGKGKKQGLGDESGGDLDTVASNAFYGAWIEDELSDNGGAEYGEDYEFDFVNYQQGFRHLDIHEGCDIYLPDFPIDAMPPRLEMRKIRREEEIDVRAELYEDSDAVRKLFYGRLDELTDEWKERYNQLKYRADKIRGERQFYEVKTLREYTGLFRAVAQQAIEEDGGGEAISLISEKLFGDELNLLRADVADELDSYIKRDLVDEVDAEQVQTRLMLDDSANSDYGSLYRMKDADQLLEVWVEALSVIVSTYFLINNCQNDLPDNGVDDLLDWTETIRTLVHEYNQELLDVLEQVHEANPDNENVGSMLEHVRSINDLWENLSYDWVIDQYNPLEDVLAVQVVEESTGRPISDLEVVFNVTQGMVSLSPMDEPDRQVQSLAVPTNEMGAAAVQFENEGEDVDYGVTATYNELHFATFPEELTLTDDYFDEHPDPESIELRLVEYLSGEESVKEDTVNVDQIEGGGPVESDRAVDVQCDLMESDLRYLAEQDVRLVRIDDHHPYTPEMLETLEDLVEEGVIKEEIRLSSLPRGEHQPKEKQLCGADLVYSKFVEGTGADNEGMAGLRDEAHLQDLHIEESEIALELSKLIGSKYNKIEMAHNLKDIQCGEDLENIMSDTGWDEAVETYEEGLRKVCPRLENTLHSIDMVEPPADGDYQSKIGWKRFLPQNAFTMLFGTEDEREQLYREMYANQTDDSVRAYVSLSPFCDPEEGEPNINVASAINYLTDRYDMDYYFYAYGTFLFSTRRVNEEGYEIDLSRLVSKIGSPADGGHAAAATGSPESNPSFPADRFEKVNDRNFTEYIYYITGIIEDNTELERVRLSETYPQDFEPGMVDVIERLDNNVYNLKLKGDEGTANICVTKGVYSDDHEPQLRVPSAIAYLQRKYPMDYCFFSMSTSNLILRNINDPSMKLNLDKVARTLGTFRDGGHPRAASCQPKFDPGFDEEKFGYVNSEVMEDYVKYLGEKIWKEHDFDSVNISTYS